MDRRGFIGAAVASVLASSSVAQPQQGPVPVVGFMSSRSPEESAPHAAAFRKGLGEAGYVEARNVVVEYRWAEGRYERLPALAQELVQLSVNVIVAAGGAPSALAAKGATPSVPIVFVIGDDPMRVGLVASFNRPGGNLTGVSFFTNELGGKRLGLLCELVPSASTVAMLLNPNDPGAELQRQDVQAAAIALGRRLVVLRATKPAELESVFAVLVRERVGGLVVQNDPFLDSQRERLVALAARDRVPAIYHIREFPAAGGLMSYGASLVEAYRQVGTYTGRVLNGEKPEVMPVVRPTKFELVVNVKTAKALGLTVPPGLLLRADEAIH
jgi:putative tryptophan/tyrosine transport system substrate-binding protein